MKIGVVFNSSCPYRTAQTCVQSGLMAYQCKGKGIVSKDNQGQEDDIFTEINEDEEIESSMNSELLDEDEDEFVQGSVEADDLATGFNETIPTREIDVDEDTEGDDVTQAGVEVMTELEFSGEANDVVRGDEIQLDLEDALTSGETITEAPEGD